MVKKFYFSVIVENLYIVCVMGNKLYVVCEGQKYAILLEFGLIWINYLTYGLMQKFLKLSIVLDSCRIMLLPICVMEKFQLTRARV